MLAGTIIERIEDFLSLLDECTRKHNEAFDAVGIENMRTQDILHAIEACEDPIELADLSARLKESRQRRREYKDNEKVTRYVQLWKERNEVGLGYLRTTLEKVKEYEGFVEERVYTPRVEERDYD